MVNTNSEFVFDEQQFHAHSVGRFAIPQYLTTIQDAEIVSTGVEARLVLEKNTAVSSGFSCLSFVAV